MIRELQNILYVQAQGTYVRLDHETLRVDQEGKTIAQVPLHHLGGMAGFGNVLFSPFLIHRFADDGRSIAWFGMNGRFKARLAGSTSGNVLLRKAQHEALSDPQRTLEVARAIVEGKCRASRVALLRAQREGVNGIESAVDPIETAIATLPATGSLDAVRGLEGTAASAYFSVFKSLVRRSEAEFAFAGRNRRPPRDPVNALLSFAYALLANECASALEGVGLDPQVGYLHALRPGRPALALDLMEEFRPFLADRVVLTTLNRAQLSPSDFETDPGGAVALRDDGRRTFLKAWQERKQEEVTHPLLKESVPVGLLPHVQARILARHLRGDLPAYIPFVAR